MAEAYDIIAHIYLKHLIRTSRKKLERWSSAVDQAVSSYTEELQRTVSELVGVKDGSPRSVSFFWPVWRSDPDPVLISGSWASVSARDAAQHSRCAQERRHRLPEAHLRTFTERLWKKQVCRHSASTSRTLALCKVCGQTQKFPIDFSSASYLCFPPVCSKDLDLIPDLLRWKGLSKSRVTEVLEALPGGAPTPRSRCFFCCGWCDPKTTGLLK